MSQSTSKLIRALLVLSFLILFLAAPFALPAQAASVPTGTAIVAQTAPTPPPVDWPGAIAWLGSLAVPFVLAILAKYIPGFADTPGGKLAAGVVLAAVFGALKYFLLATGADQSTLGQIVWEIIQRVLVLLTEMQLITAGAKGVRIATLALLGSKPAAMALLEPEHEKRPKAVG